MAQVRKVRCDFSGPTRVCIERLHGHRCALCGSKTSGPGYSLEASVNLGEAAHIVGASPEGPRGDFGGPAAERRAIENGVWLCKNCHALVDGDTDTFSVEALREIRELAIRRAGEEFGTVSEARGLVCGFCGTALPHGADLCTGCEARAVYGPTEREANNVVFGCILFCIALSFLIVFVLPQWANDLVGWSIPVGYGLGIWSLALVGAIGGVTATLVIPSRLRALHESLSHVRFLRVYHTGNDQHGQAQFYVEHRLPLE